MPAVDGYEVCRLLRAADPELPIISALRRRIERDPKQPTLITTVYGVGYRWEG
jgi:DNA-binding response OmpR family regulator